MKIFEKTAFEQERIDGFLSAADERLEKLNGYGEYAQINALKSIREHFDVKIQDFYRSDRKLNIGIIGQVKAGKSTFLNTLLFGGKSVLPTARTPKTAALTKIEYSENNRICVEYYTVDEWKILEDYANTDIEDNEHIVARETMKMVADSGVNPYEYLEKGTKDITFPSFDALMGQLNEYVGENGRFTPMVKNVTLYMDKPELAEISVVDTPGMNDAIASRTDRTREFIEKCDVVFFLSRGSQFLDTNDIKLISAQLPQKGVANLILICSQFDVALLDELRKCGSLRATIDKVKSKLIEHARETFSREIQNNSMADKFIANCSEPVFISSIINNIIDKPETEYSRNEAFVYKKVNKFGDFTPELMKEIGNIQSVKNIFSQITADKDITLQEKARSFIPTVRNEWNSTINELKAETERRKITLESGDKDKLEKQKKSMESQISGIKVSLETVLGDLRISLEQAKGDISRKLRENCRENSRLQERTGTEYHTKQHKVTTGHLWWKKSHYEYSNYTTTYTYLSASDALENIRTFGFESCSQIESAFHKAVDIKSTKRKLIQTVLDNFDSGDENFDINHFRHITEATLNRIEFPIIKLDVNPFIKKISSQFSGEVKNSGDRARMQNLLSEIMDKLYDVVSEQFTESVGAFKKSLDNMQETFSSELLNQIQYEFDVLCRQVEDKENAMENYIKVISLLDESSM